MNQDWKLHLSSFVISWISPQRAIVGNQHSGSKIAPELDFDTVK